MVKNKKAILWFAGIMCVYFTARGLRLAVDLPDFFRFHLTDLLFVPAMSLFALILIRRFKKDESLQIPRLTVFAQVVLISIFFEYYLPTYRSHIHPYTSDPVDVLMYFTGGVLFLVLQRKI
jgi:amino acid permease